MLALACFSRCFGTGVLHFTDARHASNRAQLSGKSWYAAYEHWLWAARAPSGVPAPPAFVPVLPAVPSDAAQSELRAKLEAKGMAAATARKACDDLALHAASMEQQLSAEARAASTGRWFNAVVRAERLAHVPGSTSAASAPISFTSASSIGGAAATDAVRTSIIRLTCAVPSGDAEETVAVEVTEAHLAKLRTLWELTQTAAAAASDTHFFEAAFAVLARLQALQGGHEQAGGMQAACPPPAFDVLREDFGVAMELFASPLNSRFPRFCSAAADVDAPFGSLGSFFHCSLLSGAFVANPPFESQMVHAMAQHMEALLSAADAAAAALTIVVIVPTWRELPGWQALANSPHRSCTLNLERAKHCYVDGGQHYGRRTAAGRLSALRLSNHETSVFFLQSARAAVEAPPTQAKQQRLARAFLAGLTPGTGRPDPEWVHPAPPLPSPPGG